MTSKPSLAFYHSPEGYSKTYLPSSDKLQASNSECQRVYEDPAFRSFIHSIPRFKGYSPRQVHLSFELESTGNKQHIWIVVRRSLSDCGLKIPHEKQYTRIYEMAKTILLGLAKKPMPELAQASPKSLISTAQPSPVEIASSAPVTPTPSPIQTSPTQQPSLSLTQQAQEIPSSPVKKETLALKPLSPEIERVKTFLAAYATERGKLLKSMEKQQQQNEAAHIQFAQETAIQLRQRKTPLPAPVKHTARNIHAEPASVLPTPSRIVLIPQKIPSPSRIGPSLLPLSYPASTQTEQLKAQLEQMRVQFAERQKESQAEWSEEFQELSAAYQERLATQTFPEEEEVEDIFEENSSEEELEEEHMSTPPMSFTTYSAPVFYSVPAAAQPVSIGLEKAIPLKRRVHLMKSPSLEEIVEPKAESPRSEPVAAPVEQKPAFEEVLLQKRPSCKVPVLGRPDPKKESIQASPCKETGLSDLLPTWRAASSFFAQLA